jgi:hypothetical protein
MSPATTGVAKAAKSRQASVVRMGRDGTAVRDKEKAERERPAFQSQS